MATASDPIAVCFSATEVVETYRSILATPAMAAFRADVVRELRGKDLACWCALDQPCHADVLLKIANEPESKPPMDDDPFHEPPVTYFDDDVRFGTGWEMIAEIKALRVQLAEAHDRGRRDMLNSLLALNPAAATALAKLSGEEPDPDGRLPFSVVVWVTKVAEQLGIKPLDEIEESPHG